MGCKLFYTLFDITILICDNLSMIYLKLFIKNNGKSKQGKYE